MSSRAIERACRQNVMFMALSGDASPSYTHIAKFVRELGTAVIAPAPTCAGQSRIAVLCLGSNHPGLFNDDGYGKARVLARALSMELHRWLLQAIRKELLAKSRLTAANVELLRHEEAGHTSKVIGAALNIEAKTVDCRFQRISAKLDAHDRRTAMRIARLYGLL